MDFLKLEQELTAKIEKMNADRKVADARLAEESKQFIEYVVDGLKHYGRVLTRAQKKRVQRYLDNHLHNPYKRPLQQVGHGKPIRNTKAAATEDQKP